MMMSKKRMKNEKLNCKARDAKIDENMQVAREAGEREKAIREAH